MSETDEQANEPTDVQLPSQAKFDFHVWLTTKSDNGRDGKPPPTVSFYKAQKEYADKAAAKATEDLDATRRRGDIWGKAVLSIGSALVTALGIGALVNVFPVSDRGGWTAVFVAGFAFLVAVFGVIVVGMAVSSANEPLVIDTDSDTKAAAPDVFQSTAAQDREREIVKKIFDRFAVVNGYERLRQYSTEALVIERVRVELENKGGELTSADASRIAMLLYEIPPENPTEGDIRYVQRLAADMEKNGDKLVQRASMIRSEVGATMKAASLAVARHRVVNAIRNGRTQVALLAIPMGLVIALMAADFANANGTRQLDEISENKECVALVEAAKKQGVGVYDNCTRLDISEASSGGDEPDDDDSNIPNPVQAARAASVKELASRYDACVNNPKVEDKGICEGILLQLRSAQ